MTTLVIGDVHNKWRGMEPKVNAAVRGIDPETIVFVGDIVNDWDSSAFDEVDSARAWMDWVLRMRMERDVVVCVGNHDIPYLSESFWCPGYLADAAAEVRDIFTEVGMVLAYAEPGKALISHAGLTKSFVRDVGNPDSAHVVNVVNERFRHFDAMLNREDGPLWVRPKELSADIYEGFRAQVVGHTPVPGIQSRNFHGVDVVMCDTFSTHPRGWDLGDRSLLILD